MAHTNWGVTAVRTLIKSKHKILHVYTHPMNMDKHEKSWYESVKEECERNNIPVTERTKLTEEDSRSIRTLSPDIIFSVNWRRLIPKSIFEIPKHRTLNIHAGALPKYRGYAPIHWAMINGEKNAVVTVHYVDESADTGDIVLQKKVPIEIKDDIISTYNKALALAPELILKSLSLIESGKVRPINQKNKKGFFCGRRFPEDGRINWMEELIEVYNLIRASSDPFPNAFCFHNNKKIHVKRVELVSDDVRGVPGRICVIRNDGVIVTCGNNHKKNQALLITEI
ncbi:MAG: methionyl-tRNA formyltransferase, partial [Patescibacteria group bacterium]|nr:methionyl-tRNA formyltransferase [Patescibacteria group bacterium]